MLLEDKKLEAKYDKELENQSHNYEQLSKYLQNIKEYKFKLWLSRATSTNNDSKPKLTLPTILIESFTGDRKFFLPG